MMVGPVGTGKTSVVENTLAKLDAKTYSVLTVNMSAQVSFYRNFWPRCHGLGWGKVRTTGREKDGDFNKTGFCNIIKFVMNSDSTLLMYVQCLNLFLFM